MQRFLLLLLALFFPAITFAAPIGFSKAPVWVSRTPVIEGETVSIHASIGNGSAGTLTGNVIFRDDGDVLATIPISLKEDEAKVISTAWTPKAGTHQLAVELANATPAEAARTETLIVPVAAKEKAGESAATAGDDRLVSASPTFSDSSGIQSAIAKASPTVATFVAPAFNTVDAWRKSGSDFLVQHTDATKQKLDTLAAKKVLLADQDTDLAKSERRNATVSQVLHTIILYVYEGVNLALSKAGIFFPLIAILFFLCLWKLYRRFRRPW